MAINYSEIKYIPVTELLSQYQSGSLQHLPEDLYMRREITQENINNKVIALSYYTPDGYLVRVDDPITLYTDSQGQKRILSGNSRVAALAYMMQHDEYKKRNFANVPYRETLETPTDDEIRSLQRSTNDFVEAHTPIELAREAYTLKQKKLAELQPQVDTGKLKVKQAGRQATDYVMQQLKIDTESYLSNLNKVASAPDQVIALVDKGNLTLDGAVKLMEWWDKSKAENSDESVRNEYISQTIKQLFEIVTEEMGASLSILDSKEREEETRLLKIAPRHLKKLLKAPKPLPSPEVSAGTETPTESVDGSPVAETSNGAKPVQEEEIDKSSKNITKGDAKANIQTILESVQSVSPDTISIQNGQDLSETMTDMLKLMAETNILFNAQDCLEIFAEVREAFLKRFGNLDYVLKRVEEDNDYPLSKFNTKMNKLSKPLAKIINSLNPENAQEPSSNPTVQTEELPSITVLETDTHIGEVSVPF